MQTVYLHIGYPKTASSLLQQQIFPGLRDMTYVRIDKEINDLRNCTDIVNAPADARILISSENLSFGSVWNVDKYTPQEKAAMLKAQFPEALIIIIIREQTDFIVSLYAHLVKRGSLWQDWDKFFQKFFPFIENYLRFDVLIAQYQSLFGKDRVLVLAYEEMVSDPATFYRKLGDFMGTDLSHAVEKAGLRVNKSSRSRRYIGAMIACNFLMGCVLWPFEKSRLFKNLHILRRNIAGIYEPVVARLFSRGDKLVLSDRQQAMLAEALHSSNERADAITDGELRKWGYM